MTGKPKGTLIIIGGHEEKKGDQPILSEVASHARKGKGRLVVVTVASNVPEELSNEYRLIFEGLGLK